MELEDGRRVAFEERGDRDGFPVLRFHGTPGSRWEQFPGEEATAGLGVRLITFDRPGYGRSDPRPDRTLLDVAGDAEQLADALGVDAFAVTGMSGGAPFALATAWSYPDRVTAAALTCGIGPLDRPGALEGMHAPNAREFSCAAQEPERLENLLSDGSLAADLPAEEVRAFGEIDGLGEALAPGLAEAARQGWVGVLADDLAFVRPWGFDLAAITVPVSLWHGDRDSLVPFHHAEHLAAQIPGATLHRCRGEGHLAMFGRQEEALASLLPRLIRGGCRQVATGRSASRHSSMP
ncbi:alpha/beta hydrolase [Amycolatopsis ultiminotia]|uniref:Alpha/beta hydrolase n=1 Tax=Amycolatopsis ultiminotia TaxID=543629 RepID=A0ABP6WH68_9PSEU